MKTVLESLSLDLITPTPIFNHSFDLLMFKMVQILLLTLLWRVITNHSKFFILNLKNISTKSDSFKMFSVTLTKSFKWKEVLKTNILL